MLIIMIFIALVVSGDDASGQPIDSLFPWENEFPSEVTEQPPVWTTDTSTTDDSVSTIEVTNVETTTMTSSATAAITSVPGVTTTTAIYFPGFIWNGQGGWTASSSGDCVSLSGLSRIICQLLPRFFLNLQTDAMSG